MKTGSVQQDMQTVKALILDQNWKLFKAQKTIVLDIQSKKVKGGSAEWEALEGILCLMDKIQDIAVDVYDVKLEAIKLDEAKKIVLQELEN